MSLLSLEDAQLQLLEGVEPLATECLPVEQARGRYLAAPLIARRTQPAEDLSAMDGYAVRADDLAGPWRVVGESAAGHPFRATLRRGEAVRISTGALMPDDAGAVLLQENAVRDGDLLSLNAEGTPEPRHIRRKGFDFAQGDAVAATGLPVNPAMQALALAAGHRELDVHRLPTLAILDSGDELAADPADCAAHQIPASNGAMLAAMAAPFARQTTRLGPVPDRIEAMMEALARAGDVDVIVTSGGASVGDHDLVRPALERWGATIEFWKVAIKPGKPLLVARKGGQHIIGLPGNPVSSYVTAFVFLLPLLRHLAGASSPHPQPVQLQTSMDLPATGSRAEFVRARLDKGFAAPVCQQDSSALCALASAQVLIYRPANAAAVGSGAIVCAYPILNGGIA